MPSIFSAQHRTKQISTADYTDSADKKQSHLAIRVIRVIRGYIFF